MAIQEHPLANTLKLGELVTTTVFDSGTPNGQQANWECLFSYERGSVRMSMVHNQAVYKTVMDDEVEIPYEKDNVERMQEAAY